MRAVVVFALVAAPLLGITPCTRPPQSNSIFGVYVGTSMCADVSRPLLAIPADAQCDRTKWSLTLYRDPVTQSPTTYKLTSEYGYHVDNRTLVMKGSNVSEGKWAISRGAKPDRKAVVYQLDPDTPQKTISFQEMDLNIIHLLDRDGSLVLGTSAQSFSLTRTEPMRSAANPVPNILLKDISGLLKTPESSVVGVFGGRTPCREVAQQLNQSVPNDCMKLKWEITFYQDPKSKMPTKYKLRGTLFRDFDREGKWTVVRGRQADPQAVVYKVGLDNGRSLLLFNADDRILFFLENDGNLMAGSKDFSYTLNRDESPDKP